MKIERKEGVKKFRIVHNKKLGLIIIGLILLFILVIVFLMNNVKNKCVVDEDCVSASCCHPESCVAKELKPDCDGMFCSAVCSGPLDCGAGHCGCVQGKCEVVSDEQKN